MLSDLIQDPVTPISESNFVIGRQAHIVEEQKHYNFLRKRNHKCFKLKSYIVKNKARSGKRP